MVKGDIRAALYMALNLLSSVVLVITNKILMNLYDFKFATFLTCLHLITTYSVLQSGASAKVFVSRKIPFFNVFQLACGSMGFICLTNLSLQHNSVGFYQIMKVMTLPVVAFLEWLVSERKFSNSVLFSLATVCAGACIVSVTDFQVNFAGFVYAFLALFATSFYQVWGGAIQKSLNCNALQLQLRISPLAGFMLTPFIMLFDNVSGKGNSLVTFQFSRTSVLLIALTCFLSVLVNVSIFLVIGVSSPVSYNILGHGKNVFIVASDFLIFGRPLTMRGNVGIFVTMFGAAWYSTIQLRERRKIEDKLFDSAEE